MTVIKINNQEQSIDCKKDLCGNCEHKPLSTDEQKCKLFNVMLDHINTSFADKSGWKRCEECIKAEI